MAALDDLRQRLGDALRDRVAGPGAEERAAQLLGAPGPRWFGEDRPIRTVHADASMFVGGLRALLLQTLHPRAMAGVAQHSDYRHDPWGRLQRTADFLAATTYGTAEVAQQTVDRVAAVHRRVTGTPPLPVPARPVYGALVAAAIATLPAWSRPMLRLPWLPVAERVALRPLGALVTEAIRWATFEDSPFRQAEAASATNRS
ncbi:MAG: DUF2236 domain-containing protein [Actinobacteria bacterium]|nr:DUF2236 domain-containing protein [Actinomycetota bacterium]